MDFTVQLERQAEQQLAIHLEFFKEYYVFNTLVSQQYHGLKKTIPGELVGPNWIVVINIKLSTLYD